MKPFRYRLWVCLLFALLLTAVFGAGALADDEGTCGPDLTWKLEGDLLTISGTGPMDDYIEIYPQGYAVTTAPWDEYHFKWVVIEEGVTSIGDEAFFNHVWVESVELPDTLVTIGKHAFSCCGMTEIAIPDSVRQIKENAFSVCHNLESVTLPDFVYSVEFGVFQGCGKLTKVTLPDSIKNIEGYAFARCPKLKEINLPASVKSIDAEAFLETVHIQNIIVEKDSYAERFCVMQKLPYSYADTPVTSGNEDGGQLVWELDNGTLTISGTGDMNDYKRMFGGREETTAPWSGEKITQLVIEPGITGVGDYAFWGCRQLKTVILPDTLKRIGKSAFEECDLLSDITMPEGVAEIGKKAFSKCGNLITIALPASVSILGEDVFAGCVKLEKVIVEPGSYGEQYCVENSLSYTSGETLPEAAPTPGQPDVKKSNTCGENLTWKLENGTLTISGTGRMDNYDQAGEKTGRREAMPAEGTFAPWAGSLISRVVIEEGVTSIGTYAFERSAVTEITLPSTLVSVEYGAFDNCKELKTVTLPDSVTEIGMLAFNECTGLEDVRLPASLASIGAAAFRSCIKLSEVTLPDAVREVGMYAFYNCTALQTVTLPASLQTLGEYTFDSCQALRAVIVPKDSYAEQYCIGKGIEYVYTGSSPEAVPTEMPYGICGKNMTWRLDSDGTLTISGFGKMDDYYRIDVDPEVYGNTYYGGSTAPWFGRKFTRVVVEEGVERIGSYAFCVCENLQTIELPDTLQAIGSHALSFTQLREVVLPDSVTFLGEDVFFGAHALEHVQLPAGLKVIPAQMFCGCDALLEMTLPETLERIETSAFDGCRRLMEITLPPSLFYISSTAFHDCPSLKKYIVTKGSYAEEYCAEKGLPYFYTDGTVPERIVREAATNGTCGKNLTWSLENGTLTISGSGKMENYKEAVEGVYIVGTTAPWFDKEINTVIVEEGVTSIGDYAFALQDNLTWVDLPDTLVSIGVEAFWNCRITEIDLPDSVRTIRDNAFSSCGSLRRVKLPAGIGGIEFGVFQNCYSLKDITLPDTVRTIGDYSFYGCSGLKEIIFPASVKYISESAFEECSKLVITLQGENQAAERYCVKNNLKYQYAENK